MSHANALSRRRFVLSSLGLASTWQLQRAAQALGLNAQATVCKLSAEQEVGPYYVAEELLRADIREGKPGVPLTLRVAVLDARTCEPLPNVAVDLWHCDALGVYSGFTKVVPMGPPEGIEAGGPPPGPPPGFDPQHPESRPGPPEGFGPPPENHPTDELTFLRGVQMTDAKGVVEFRTVFPGVYPGRTNHVHYKVRLGGHAAAHGSGQTYAASHVSHVGQVFFPEDLCVELMKLAPYSGHQIHRTTQAGDMVFSGQHGELALARVAWNTPGDAGAGLRAEMIAAADPTATPAAVGMGGGPMGRPLGRRRR